MDFGDEDELDFEEDLPENELTKNNEPESGREEKTEDPDVNGCDQYLQIDCLEDEEDLLSKITVDPEKPENTVNDKELGCKVSDSLNEENEKPEYKEEPPENQEEDYLQTSNFGNTKGQKGKERSFGVPLYRTPGPVRSNRWRPGNNFMRPTRQNVGQRLNHVKGLPLRYPKLHHFSQNYLQNQNEFVSLLGLSETKSQNMQQMNNLFAQCSNPMLEVNKNFIRNGILGQCSNPILNQFQYNDFSRFKGVLEQKIAAEANCKNFPVRCMNGFKTNYNRGSFNEGRCDKEQMTRHILPEVEKELVKSKKEARLLRFMNDQTAKKEMRSNENMSEKPTMESLNLEEEYFRRMEEQKRKREEIFSLKEKQKADNCNEDSASDKMPINKEFLLKKENPFENSLKILGNNIKFEIKQEKRDDNVRVNQNGSSLPDGLCFVKKEVESPVKFIRTVSKSFEELGLSKTNGGLFLESSRNGADTRLGNDLHFENVPKVELVDTASQTQTEPHLTGCIVKILNVPPSTSANDVLALCTPFGAVREVKLNFPKENSVAIRFAEPNSAENFFKLYNGRVIDNHTLNVITV